MAYIEDYDLAIGAVTLAQFGGMSNRPYTSYAQGRRVCGLAAGVSGAAIYALPDGRQMRLSAGEAALIPAASLAQGRRGAVCPRLHLPRLGVCRGNQHVHQAC